MIRDLGVVEPGTTLYIPFHTFDSNDPSASVTLTGLATTDIEIYSNGSVTQRASDNGYALLDSDGIDFDGITGIHGLSINLADNSTAGFYAAGNQYWVVISSVTVDGATINFILCTFRIGYRAAILNTTIASLSSQTSFTLTAGPAEDDALNGCMVLIHDVASAVQIGIGVVSDYTGSTKTVTLLAGVTFTAAATDNISFFPPVNASHAGAVAYSTTRGLAGTALPNAAAEAAGGLYTRGSGAGQIAQDANGRVNVNVAAIETADPTDTIRDAVVDDATRIDASALNTLSSHDPGETIMGATDAITVTTNNDKTGYGLADGAITAAKIADNAIDAGAIAADAITGDKIAAGALAKGDQITGFNDLSAAQVNAEADAAIETYHLDHLLAAPYDAQAKPGDPDALLNAVVESDDASPALPRFTAGALEEAPTGGSAPTAGEIADAVWEEAIADHEGTAGSTAEQLAAAGSAGDPWATALPGSYTSGQAGKIVGDNLNATVGSRATQTSVDDLPTNSELSTALASSDDAVLAAIAALNDLSQADVITALLDEADTIETGLTVRGALRLALAALAGKLSGANTATSTFRNVGDTKDRIVATTDATGRTNVTVDAS